MLQSIRRKVKNPFGSLNITWPKLIVFAVAAGIYTGVMVMLPMARDTSFADIGITFEWWVLFGMTRRRIFDSRRIPAATPPPR